MSCVNENYFEHHQVLGLTIDDCKRINKSCRFINSFIKENGLRYTYDRSFVSVLKRNNRVQIKYNNITDITNKNLLINFFYRHFPKSTISTKRWSIRCDVTPYMMFY
jgi:hypothetical protein